MAGNSRSGRRRGVRKGPQQDRSRQTVEHLLEGATRVFAREGPSATTNRIAAATGVSVGSLYQYFDSKDALLEELAMRHLDDAVTTLGPAIDRAGPSRADLARDVVAAAVDLHAEHGSLHRFMREFAPRSPRLVAAYQQTMNSISTRLEAATQSRGVSDPAACARAIAVTLDAHVHTIIAAELDAARRDRQIAVLEQQVLALLARY